MTLKSPRLAGWASQRTSLWLLLLGLVVALLGLLIWLAGRYEASLVQSRLDHNAAEAVVDIRSGLNRNIQELQAFQAPYAQEPGMASWTFSASRMLHESREILRLEWRNQTLDVLGVVETSFRSPVFERLNRDSLQADVNLTCDTARRMSGAAYSASYFLPQADGLGLEVLDLCLPVVVAGRLSGYTVATYSLQSILGELVGPILSRGVALSFTEADGTRLALQGAPLRGSRIFVAQQLLDLPGTALVVRMESRLGSPAIFPNVLTALVAAMSLALLVVLFLLGRDMRRRLQAEHDLGEALAFRKAMENSLLTGLRIGNAWVLGPLLGVGLVTGLGFSLSALPAWVVNGGQLLIAVALGCRFSPAFFRAAPRFLTAATFSALLAIALGGLLALLATALTNAPVATLVLAAAPGGVAEMCITAQVMQLGVPLVTVCHVMRVVVLTVGAPTLYRLFLHITD